MAEDFFTFVLVVASKAAGCPTLAPNVAAAVLDSVSDVNKAYSAGQLFVIDLWALLVRIASNELRCWWWGDCCCVV